MWIYLPGCKLRHIKSTFRKGWMTGKFPENAFPLQFDDGSYWTSLPIFDLLQKGEAFWLAAITKKRLSKVPQTPLTKTCCVAGLYFHSRIWFRITRKKDSSSSHLRAQFKGILPDGWSYQAEVIILQLVRYPLVGNAVFHFLSFTTSELY